MTKWSGKRVVIIGAARQGLALARYLEKNGAFVTVNDQRSAEQLKDAMDSLQSTAVRWVVGGHPLSLLDGTDLVAVSGGVPLTLPIIQEAQKRGVPLTNDSQIFMSEVPCPVIALTGSAGKTTTTTLVGRMAKTAVPAPRQVWVGGNIGLPLIEKVDVMGSDDVVILELSSFQLELMTYSPHIAAVLNITPNHLDRHGTMEAYTSAKARILEFQHPDSLTVLNREDSGSWSLRGMVIGKLVGFGLAQPPAGENGTYVSNGYLWLQDGERQTRLFEQDAIQLRGQHNLVNVLAACAIAYAAGWDANAMLAGVQDFRGVAHRLELVRVWHGAAWYNDSIATAPERTAAAIRAFNEPLVLMLGGRDKNLPWEDLAELIHQRVEHVVLFGEAAPKIAHVLGEIRPYQLPHTIQNVGNLRQAVEAAAKVAQPGQVVLLSPGGTSYDEFKDFEERGEKFRELVNELL